MRGWLIVLVACAGAPTAHGPAPAPAPVAPKPVVVFPATGLFRLAHTFEPSQYRARIALADKRFTGHIEIDGELADTVTLIWLHGVALDVSRAVAVHDGVTIELDASSAQADQLIGLQSKTPLPAGHWTLIVDYTAPIHDLERPTLNSWHQLDDAWSYGVFRRIIGAHTYVFTQSEAIYARHIFPCIDEPDRKVPWQLTLEVASDVTAASNTPIVRETPIDATHKRVEFAATRPLPSYLIAFAVGAFDIVDAGIAKSGAPIRVLVEHGSADRAAWAAKTTAPLLDTIADYTSIPYPYPKLDIVAVAHPGWGAMENPGLITVGANFIELWHDQNILAHELAHQWFGNLVTMAWWDDIWLNESFATWMANRLSRGTLDAAEIRWHALHQLDTTPLQRAINGTESLDGRSFSPNDLNRKGAAVLDALEIYVGEDRFRAAIHDYLELHTDKLVTTSDFVDALVRTTAQPTLAATFAGLSTHPVATLEMAMSCRNRNTLQVVSIAWPMRICVAYDRDGARAERCVDATDATHEIFLDGKRCPRWVMPDANAVGLYEVAWSNAMVDGVLANGWASLTTVERHTLYAEVVDDERGLRMMLRMLDGPDALPWSSVVARLFGTAKYVPVDLQPRLDAWIIARFGAEARALHFGPVAHGADAVDRIRLVELVARSGEPHLAADAAQATSPSHTQFEAAILMLRARADAKLRASLVGELRSGSATLHDVDRTRLLLRALPHVPGIIDDLEADPSLLAAVHPDYLAKLFDETCDAAVRARMATLARNHPHRLELALARVDACLVMQRRLDPVFRAWLTP